jgi:hypothetical protein
VRSLQARHADREGLDVKCRQVSQMSPLFFPDPDDFVGWLPEPASGALARSLGRAASFGSMPPYFAFQE